MKLLTLFRILMFDFAIATEHLSVLSKPLTGVTTKNDVGLEFVDLGKKKIKSLLTETKESSEDLSDEEYRTPLLSPKSRGGSLPEEDVWDAAGQIVHNAISRVEGSIGNRASSLAAIEALTQDGLSCIQMFGDASESDTLKIIPLQTTKIREGMALYAAAEKLWDQLRQIKRGSNNAPLRLFSDLQPGNHVRALNDMRNQSEKVFVVRKVEGEAVFLEDTERSMTSDSILRTIDPLEAVAIDVTLSNRWHKLEKEDPVLKAHLAEYLKRKGIISENHPLFGMAMQEVVHGALLEKSDGYALIMGIRRLMQAPLPSPPQQKSKRVLKDISVHETIFGIDEAVSMIETLQLILREHCLPNCLPLNYSNLMVQRSALLVHLLERYLLTSPVASPGNHKSKLGDSILRGFNAESLIPIDSIEKSLQMQQQCSAGLLAELGWHGSSVGNLSCGAFWKQVHRRSILSGYSVTSHEEAGILQATCNDSSTELLPKGLFKGCDDRCILAAVRHHRNTYTSNTRSKEGFRILGSDRTGDVLRLSQHFSGEDILQLDNKCAAALEAAKFFVEAFQSIPTIRVNTFSEPKLSAVKDRSLPSGDATDHTDGDSQDAVDVVLLEDGDGLKRRRTQVQGAAKYQRLQNNSGEQGAIFEHKKSMNRRDTEGHLSTSRKYSTSSNGGLISYGFNDIDTEEPSVPKVSSVLTDEDALQIATEFEATGEYCRKLMNMGDLGNLLLLAAGTHSDIRGYIDDTGAGTESAKAQRKIAREGNSLYGGLSKYLACGFSGEMLPPLHAPVASVALQLYNYLRIKVEESKSLHWEDVVSITSAGVFSASKYAKISSRLRKLAREFIRNFLPCPAGSVQQTTKLEKNLKSKAGFLNKLRYFSRQIKSKAREEQTLCRDGVNLRQFSLMLVAWWVLGLPRGSNTDKALVTAPDTLRGARLLFATFVFYRGDDPVENAVALLHLHCKSAFKPSAKWALLSTHRSKNGVIPYRKVSSQIRLALQYIQATGEAMDTANWNAVTKISLQTAKQCRAGELETQISSSEGRGFRQILLGYQCLKLQDQGVDMLSQVFGKGYMTIAPLELDQAFLFLAGVNRWQKSPNTLGRLYKEFAVTSDVERRASILKEWNGPDFPEVTCPWKSNSRSKFLMGVKAAMHLPVDTSKDEYSEIRREMYCTENAAVTAGDLVEDSKEERRDICLGHSASCIAEEFLWNP